jgi:hypothetical protein
MAASMNEPRHTIGPLGQSQSPTGIQVGTGHQLDRCRIEYGLLLLQMARERRGRDSSSRSTGANMYLQPCGVSQTLVPET